MIQRKFAVDDIRSGVSLLETSLDHACNMTHFSFIHRYRSKKGTKPPNSARSKPRFTQQLSLSLKLVLLLMKFTGFGDKHTVPVFFKGSSPDLVSKHYADLLLQFVFQWC